MNLVLMETQGLKDSKALEVIKERRVNKDLLVQLEVLETQELQVN